jgi:hypothetical protein
MGVASAGAAKGAVSEGRSVDKSNAPESAAAGAFDSRIKWGTVAGRNLGSMPWTGQCLQARPGRNLEEGKGRIELGQ